MGIQITEIFSNLILRLPVWPESIGRKETSCSTVYFESGTVLRIS